MNFNVSISILLTGTALSNFCADSNAENYALYQAVLNSPSIVYCTEKVDPTAISQSEGKIFFRGMTLANCDQDFNSANIIVDRIYKGCATHKPEEIYEAKELLVQLKNNSDYVHHCTALMCLGETYLKDPDTYNQAIKYFSKALNTYHFTGAAIKLAAMRITDDPEAALYYILRAQEAGFELKLKKEDGSELQLTIEEILGKLNLENKAASLKTVEDVLDFEKNSKYTPLPRANNNI